MRKMQIHGLVLIAAYASQNVRLTQSSQIQKMTLTENGWRLTRNTQKSGPLSQSKKIRLKTAKNMNRKQASLRNTFPKKLAQATPNSLKSLLIHRLV